jgi:hypothetical protein
MKWVAVIVYVIGGGDNHNHFDGINATAMGFPTVELCEEYLFDEQKKHKESTLTRDSIADQLTLTIPNFFNEMTEDGKHIWVKAILKCTQVSSP